MDNLVLSRIAWELGESLPGCHLEEFRQESAERFRLGFGTASLVVSMRPDRPWIGRPFGRWLGPRWSPDPFAVSVARSLVGRRLESVAKEPADRSLRLGFSEGRALVIELATHGANLVLLGPGLRVEAALRSPKSAGARLEIGEPYVARPKPRGRIDPFETDAAGIDRFLAERRALGDTPFEALRRHVSGVGSTGAELVVEEARLTGRSPGEVLRERLGEVDPARAAPVIESAEPPRSSSNRAAVKPGEVRLLPWRPFVARTDRGLYEEETPSATAGLYFECVESAERLHSRISGLGAILRSELRRIGVAEQRARDGAAAFGDPEVFGLRAAAILAGLTRAQRAGDTVIVPDPYDELGPPLVIDAPPGVSFVRVAEELFRKQRRARRGIEGANARAALLSARASRLAALASRHESTQDEGDVAALEEAMRAEHLPVGLSGTTRAARAAAEAAVPKLAGVRLITSADGLAILVGRTGRDNDRLTFKLAAAHDIWLHAAGVPGAHVVIRRTDRQGAPPEATLLQAARLAAWFSDARGQALVDVQWTLRKNVRRARGAPSGTVILKRSQTIRVRPSPPAIED